MTNKLEITPPVLGTQWRRENIGRLLNNTVSRFESRVINILAESGHTETRITHINLTRNLDLEGTRLTELARRANITKQSMAQLVSQLESMGMVEKLPDPSDGRARIIVFTPKGLTWLESFRDAVYQAEQEMRNQIGVKDYQVLKRCLSAYSKDFVV